MSYLTEEIPAEYTHADVDDYIKNHTVLIKNQEEDIIQQDETIIIDKFHMPRFSIEQPKILIVDDQEFNVEIAGRMI